MIFPCIIFLVYFFLQKGVQAVLAQVYQIISMYLYTAATNRSGTNMNANMWTCREL